MQHSLILPALRLATMFMYQPSLLDFWKHILFGDLVYDKERGKNHLKPSNYESTLEAYHKTHIHLTKTLSRSIKLAFRDMNTDAYSFGNEARYQEVLNGNEAPDWKTHFDTPRILLNIQYSHGIAYLSTQDSKNDRSNFYLRLAITLCHEFTHIVWKSRVRGDYPEPLYNFDDSQVELGDAWERHAFGGKIWTVDHPGYFMTYYRPRSVHEDNRGLDARVVVPRW
jgi:hypothetical protein